MNDPIGDMLTRIKNAYLARRKDVEIPYSNIKERLVVLLKREGFVGEMEKTPDGKQLLVRLLYPNGIAAFADMKRISKPGIRRYIKASELSKLHFGLGHVILSTPKGLKTQQEAQKEKVGGEILCRVW